MVEKQLGNGWETAEKRPGNSWEAAGKRLRNGWEIAGKRLGNSWEMDGKRLGNGWETARKQLGNGLRNSWEIAGGTDGEGGELTPPPPLTTFVVSPDSGEILHRLATSLSAGYIRCRELELLRFRVFREITRLSQFLFF